MTDDLVAKLVATREKIVGRVVEAAYRDDPDVWSRLGAAGRRRFEEDTRVHLDCLSAALSLAAPRVFETYVGWLVPLLEARGVSRGHVEQSLRRLSDAVVDDLGSAFAAPVVALIDTALRLPPESLQEQALGSAAAFFAAIVRADRPAALSEARVALGRGVDHLYEEVVAPAMHQVGRLWQRNQLRVGEEHLATALAQATIASLYPEFPWSEGGPIALVAAPPGERHEFGARMFADLLSVDGWRTRFLGANTPVESLAQMAAEPSIRLVAISVSVPISLPAARHMALAVRRSAPSVAILAGGRALQDLADPVASLGVDACALTAREGRDAARRWRA